MSTTSLADAAAKASGGPIAELRLIALFVAKWKLDPTRTKVLLSKLTAARRRYVVRKFSTDTTGLAATTALEEFIKECEVLGEWDTAAEEEKATTNGAKATPGAPNTPVGIKRPLSAQPCAKSCRAKAEDHASVDAFGSGEGCYRRSQKAYGGYLTSGCETRGIVKGGDTSI